MQLEREKESRKINFCKVSVNNVNNVSIVTLNIDTDFIFDFLILQKYSKI